MPKKQVIRLSEEISALGSLPFYCFVALLFLFLDRLELAADLFIGLAIAYPVTIAVRLAYHRDRPVPEEFTSILERIDAAGFPSMHSYRAGLLLLVPLHYWSWKMGILFASVAMMVWCTRYSLKRHHIPDIAAGAALGIITALTIL